MIFSLHQTIRPAFIIATFAAITLPLVLLFFFFAGDIGFQFAFSFFIVPYGMSRTFFGGDEEIFLTDLTILPFFIAMSVLLVFFLLFSLFHILYYLKKPQKYWLSALFILCFTIASVLFNALYGYEF